MISTVEYGVAVQEDEFADEHVVDRTYDYAAALDALRQTPFTRSYLVQRTASGWVEAR
ncbi:hypothetical protein [Streptomyces venezuelae]|uniref:hypothetical protein n=1 Tax=Streptomyces venezuelae TaxID=54571 RepID=UPI00341687BD